jgi:NADH-quinone oxidoreductase subunit L
MGSFSTQQIVWLCTFAVFAPMVAGVIVGLFGRVIGTRAASHITCWSVGLACLVSLLLFVLIFEEPLFTLKGNWYEWGVIGDMSLSIGFLIDRLSIMMMATVLTVSLLVHIYSIGYMQEDPGYTRFFAYISLFTFAMLMLVVANNFLQLFFGWEGVGVMSYLLIGFWFGRESANVASVKAFIVNRVGDIGLLLGVATVAWFFGSLDYGAVFHHIGNSEISDPVIQVGSMSWPVFTVITTCLWIGAMAKSAQVPLHIWLPDSMEGPTPISALIHAATMVTAGIFMVARLSPLFEQSETVLNAILIIGTLTAVLTGLMGVVQSDIKRIIAYSTLSQLGYMAVGLGASAYAISIFHLMTHAFFKALLFLGAGSVILAMHHEQNIWKMGGLKKYLPITHAVMILGSLSLVGIPPFSGFFSKELLIEAAHYCRLPAAGFAYWGLVLSVFVTALYSFRLLFVVFYGSAREGNHKQVLESPPVIYIPLLCLTVPTLMLGIFLVDSVLFERFSAAIMPKPNHDVMRVLYGQFEWEGGMIWHSFSTLPFWLAVSGIVTAWLAYVRYPSLPSMAATRMAWIFNVLRYKLGFDAIVDYAILPATRGASTVLGQVVDRFVIDNLGINGVAAVVVRCAKVIRKCQTGYLYHYAFTMIAGLLILWVLMN